MRGTSNKGLEAIMSVEPLHLFLEGIAISTRIRIQEEVPQCWNGESNYHYRRKANQIQKKKKYGHVKELDSRISEIFTKPLIKDKVKKGKIY